MKKNTSQKQTLSLLWRFLKGDKRLSSFRLGQYGEGDGGVTVVEIK